MKLRLLTLAALCASVFSVSTVLAEEQVKADDAPYPLEYWALRSVINNAQVSPDGKYLAIMKIPSRDGDPIIEVYEADDLEAEPFRLNADPMEITSFEWVSDKVLAFNARQKVRDTIDGFNQGVYEFKLAAVDVEKKKIKQFKESGPSIANVLPSKKDKIILSFSEGGGDGPGSRINSAFRPRAYWEYDINRGSKKLLIRGKLSLGNISFDGEGNPWLARGFDIDTGEFTWYLRPKGEKGWTEIYRLSEDSFDDFVVYGFDEASPGHLIVGAQNGRNTAALWSFNYETGDFAELIYARNDVDITGVRRHSNRWANYDAITGVRYYKDKFHTEYFDEIEGAVYNQLEQIIPHAHTVSINSRSRDGSTLTVVNTGPRDPGTYYLLKNGQMTAVGSRQPLLESEKLADVKWIEWESRDGKMVPGFITIPNSEPPYPLVVMPHGGPFVRETVVYDEWAQMLANNGYMVLQPQYRGSQGYGEDFYTTAFRDGGTGGFQMQDDKDDGALYLVEQGLADRDRLAMFGWSYGGYAALIAASRTPQIYQCAIAGAAVTDNNMQVNYYRYALRGASQIEQLRFWDDSLSPLEEVSKVNIPLLMIHGDVDQRVPPEHARKYVKKLDEYNKNYRFLWLEGADHFSNTLFYDHQIKLFTNMIDFLNNDCGDGGLQAAVK